MLGRIFDLFNKIGIPARLWATIIFLIFFFIIGLFSFKGDFIFSTAFAVSFTIFIEIWLYFSNLVGRYRHRKIIDSSLFIEFRETLNFTKEVLNDSYYGYKGTYRGYFIRAYYNPQGFSNEKEINLIIYHKDWLPENEEDLLGIENRLEELYKSYGKKGFDSRKNEILFEPMYLVAYRPINLLTRFAQIKKTLDFGIDVAIKEKFSCIDQETISIKMKDNPYIYGPPIDTFMEQ